MLIINNRKISIRESFIPSYDWLMDGYFISPDGEFLVVRILLKIINIDYYVTKFNCKYVQATFVGSKENLLMLCEDLNRLQKLLNLN